MDALYKWWFIVSSCVVGSMFVQGFGLWTALWYADATKISFILLALFIGVTGYIGYQIRQVKKTTLNISKVNLELPSLWNATEAMNALGMIGTLGGFLIMLNLAFGGNINVTDADAARKLIASAALGLSTSACATLVGLVCATVTKLQLVILEKLIAERS